MCVQSKNVFLLLLTAAGAVITGNSGYDKNPFVSESLHRREPSGRLVALSAWLPPAGRFIWSTVYTPLTVNTREMAAKYEAYIRNWKEMWGLFTLWRMSLKLMNSFIQLFPLVSLGSPPSDVFRLFISTLSCLYSINLFKCSLFYFILYLYSTISNLW